MLDTLSLQLRFSTEEHHNRDSHMPAVCTYSRMGGKSHYNRYCKFRVWWLLQSRITRCVQIFISLMVSLICLFPSEKVVFLHSLPSSNHILLNISCNHQLLFMFIITIDTRTQPKSPGILQFDSFVFTFPDIR